MYEVASRRSTLVYRTFPTEGIHDDTGFTYVSLCVTALPVATCSYYWDILPHQDTSMYIGYDPLAQALNVTYQFD